MKTGWNLIKSLTLTVPVVDSPDVSILSPTSDLLKLVGTHPDMLYGLHGSTSSKQPVLSAAFALADQGGQLTAQKSMFYLIDMTFRAPENIADSDQVFAAHLAPEMLNKAPFINPRRLLADAGVRLGELWFECAKKEFGLRHATKADVKWESPASYMLAYPTVVDGVFKHFPKLRCLMMPMETKLLPAGKNVCWVGVSPRSKAKTNKVEAEVRYKGHIKVNLKADS